MALLLLLYAPAVSSIWVTDLAAPRTMSVNKGQLFSYCLIWQEKTLVFSDQAVLKMAKNDGITFLYRININALQKKTFVIWILHQGQCLSIKIHYFHSVFIWQKNVFVFLDQAVLKVAKNDGITFLYRINILLRKKNHVDLAPRTKVVNKGQLFS